MRAADPGIVLGLHRSRHERRLLTAAADFGVTAIDTSTNYLGFRSHETLARVAGDLLPKFRVSTKVGYFPAPRRAEHSLEPDRLVAAVEQAARDLGREPDLVFLHNPEQSLPAPGMLERDRLLGACSVLADAAARGMCGAWGISTWNPGPLVALGELPRPDVLMVRAGLLVSGDVLDAAEDLVARCRPSAVWGMSPFGGSRAEPVWERFDARVFLRDQQRGTPVQAAFRAAYHLPAVDAVAVGTESPGHLRELTASLSTAVDEETVSQYRLLLRARRQ